MSEVLRKRVLTALALGLPLIVIVFLLPPWVTAAAVVAVMIGAAWEWSSFLRLPSRALRALYVVAVVALAFGAWRLAENPAGLDLVLGVTLIWWVTALLWVVFAPHHVSRWSAALAGALALAPAALAFVRLRFAPPHGEWLIFALFLVFAADIAAYFFGRRFGRVRLAPEVSPGKTWEGVLGGAAVSALLAIAGSNWF
ncbi:MAG TPA: phosphatidate cytidylyltransferase, partial [Steroidobacteraceae bacterium]|nr:phosphatidate cytidylyltransferase [Steroidobacteraceae bacterium]